MNGARRRNTRADTTRQARHTRAPNERGNSRCGADRSRRSKHRQSGNIFPTFQSHDNNAVQFRLKSDSENRRIVAQDASGNNQSQIQLQDAGNIVFQGETGSSGICLQFTDSDDAGTTYCTVLDGVMSCAIGTCP